MMSFFGNSFRIEYGCSSTTFSLLFEHFSNMLNLVSLALCLCINHCGNGIRF